MIRRLTHDQALFAYALLAGLPAVFVSLGLLWTAGFRPSYCCLLSALIGACWFGFASAVRTNAIRPLQTMANLLMALREGDFSFRAHDARANDPLGVVLIEINSLSSLLQIQRRGAVEAAALLNTVMEKIDVAIFAFDQDQKLRLINREGERLLSLSADKILGLTAEEIGLKECLSGDTNRTVNLEAFRGGPGRWNLRRTIFRQDGIPHHLLVIEDLRHALREEELLAWQRLVRVLGHELNNSLAPIKSITGSLDTLLQRQPRPFDWEEDLRLGLNVIATRTDSLLRFMQAYARLVRLPPPAKSRNEIAPLIARVVALETRLPVQVTGGPPIAASYDPAQIEQLLINLVKNAVEATLEQSAATGKTLGVRTGWRVAEAEIEIYIEDDGAGVAHASNLFVPFFTTKPEGTGIGLVLSRQIAENHGGSLKLISRESAPGTIAVLRIPIQDNSEPLRPESSGT